MNTPSRVILNGDLVPRGAAHLSIDDLGFLVGDGVFETLRADDGVPALLDEHLSRLFAGLDALRLAIPWTRAEIAAQVRHLVATETPRGTARVRITVSRGPGQAPWTAHDTPTLLATAEPYAPREDIYTRGVEVEISCHARQPHPLHGVKSTSWQWNLWQRREASGPEVFEVVQFNADGCLAEGSFTNIFVGDVSGVLRTPLIDEGCLRGVTRDAVLRLARAADIQVVEGGIDRDTLAGAREVFLTGSLVEVVPVRSIEDRLVGETIPGPLARSLGAAYAALVRGPTGERTTPLVPPPGS